MRIEQALEDHRRVWQWNEDLGRILCGAANALYLQHHKQQLFHKLFRVVGSELERAVIEPPLHCGCLQ